jgi:hypothetical protein
MSFRRKEESGAVPAVRYIFLLFGIKSLDCARDDKQLKRMLLPSGLGFFFT